MFETVIFTVAGRELAHKSCKLSAGAERAVREAEFDIAWTGDGLPCMWGDEATVMAGELWGTGYVRDVRPSHDGLGRSYSVTFMSKTVDATETSIDHPEGLAKNVDLAAIVETFDNLGIGVEADARGDRKPFHKVHPGETLFDTIAQDAAAQGILIHDTPEGKLKLADRPEGRHAGALRRGQNILQASAQLTEAGQFSTVKVRGQATVGTSAAVLRPETAADAKIRRNRPRIIEFEGEATSERLKKRAAWEAKRGAGNGTTASITVPGWRDEAGRLWARNFLVEVDDDWIGIKQDMIIAQVDLSQDSSGTTAVLSLKDPRALGGEDPRGSSAEGWAAPAALEPTYREEGEL